ncbi:histidine phosphatase family protein [Rubellimicrobium roseum]|uniref:Histidine phosphatase family protein n=1 Tax=Rubellimicrobium roseum TaxID=687525 RepID=A0A5C4NGE4_9RHOB|nr:histidine phosphatase family protein [Rubellimicrobium roseum]TNC73801.1 histidine phosphatase family protein [Rubellimicrobium roseum]
MLRHGETEWNRQGRFQGLLDSDLTDRGRAQAVAMGAMLRSLGVSGASHAARTSPQGRARVTAQLALAGTGLSAQDDPRLVEIGMGDWTGLCRLEIDARWPGPAGEALFDFYARCPGGETLEAVAARAASVLADLDRPTVIVTHGITLRMLCALALGRPPAEGGLLLMRQGTVLRIAGGELSVMDPSGLPASVLNGNSRGPGG